jgi:hypothetical protein
VVFEVELILTLAAFEQLLPVLVFLCEARAKFYSEASVAAFSSWILVSLA